METLFWNLVEQIHKTVKGIICFKRAKKVRHTAIDRNFKM